MPGNGECGCCDRACGERGMVQTSLCQVRISSVVRGREAEASNASGAMSIYATILNFDADSEEGLGAPYVYKASHILPTTTAERGGWFEVAMIPTHCSADGKSSVDFLRIDSSPNDDGDPSVPLLLSRKHVLALRDTLNDWLHRWEEG